MLSALSVLSASLLLGSSLPTTTATTYPVYVGQSSPDAATDINGQSKWNFQKFYPSSLTVLQGDTLQFRWTSNEPHTVTYSNATTQFLISNPESATGSISHLVASNPNSTVNFTSAQQTLSSGLRTYLDIQDYSVNVQVGEGNYTLYDVLHPGAVFNLTVTTDSKQVRGAQNVTSSAQLQRSSDLSQLYTILNNSTETYLILNERDLPFPKPAPGSPEAASGLYTGSTFQNGQQTVYQVLAGYTVSELSANAARFFPTVTRINAGDGVIFDVGFDMQPHYITFNGTGAYFNDSSIDYDTPTNVQKFNGTGLANSGLLVSTQLIPTAQYQYALTFTEPGVYRYIDVLNSDIGMIGYIVVNPAGTDLSQTSQGATTLARKMQLESGVLRQPDLSHLQKHFE